MADNDRSLSYQKLSVLELLKAHCESQKDAIKILESKAQHNFTIINIVAAIVAALNLELGATEQIQKTIIERPLLTLIFIGYVLVVYFSIRALVLRKQASEPMDVSLTNAREWSTCDLEHHYDILVESYVNIYSHNEKIVELKGRRVQWAHTFIALVIVLIGLEALGLWPHIESALEPITSLLPR